MKLFSQNYINTANIKTFYYNINVGFILVKIINNNEISYEPFLNCFRNF